VLAKIAIDGGHLEEQSRSEREANQNSELYMTETNRTEQQCESRSECSVEGR
jgi:hypothetical protein